VGVKEKGAIVFAFVVTLVVVVVERINKKLNEHL